MLRTLLRMIPSRRQVMVKSRFKFRMTHNNPGLRKWNLGRSGLSKSQLTLRFRSLPLNVPLSTRTALPDHNHNASPSSRQQPSLHLQYGTGVTAPAPTPPRCESAGTPKAQSSSSRFVGDLNPEGMFMEATGSASVRETSQKGDVGIWLSSTTTTNNGPQGQGGSSSQFITSRPPPIMDQFLLPFVKEHCLPCLPPEHDFRKLRRLYLDRIHPILPIIPESSLDTSLPLEDEPATIVLRQLVCLAASTDPSMSTHLHLQNRGDELLTCQDFIQSLSSAVRAILETSIITDRVLHIRALVMLSLYTQPSSSEEADLPAQLGGRAIHHIQTLGLHLLKYDAPNCEELETLFCAVWAVDRINAAAYGRPCLMHERDIGANLDGCIKKRPPCFRLFLSVIQWLDQVIELYRPGPSAEASGLDKIAYIDLPVLEAMIVNADALKVPSPLIGSSKPIPSLKFHTNRHSNN